jgi:hypothetical protein
MFVGFADNNRAEASQFFVQQTRRAIASLGTKGITTDEFC